MPGSECRSCGAPIHWAETAKGKRIPLDPEPTRDLVGKGVQIVFEGLGGSAQARPYAIAIREVMERNGWSQEHATDHVHRQCKAYLSHFSTCPQAGEFRRGRR